MNRSSYILSFAIVVLLAAMAVFFFHMIRTADAMRFSLDEMRNEFKAMQEKISLHGFSSAPGAVAAAQRVPGANAEFFDPAAENGGRIVRALSSDVENLNPLTNNEATVSALWGIANSSLTERNYEDLDKFEPLLAESWSLSDDKLTWHIKLRNNILWHDFTDPVTGKEWKNVRVTAHDFKFYIDAVKNPDVDAAPLRGYLSGIKEVRVLNDLEFEVVWSQKYFLSKEITLGLTPLPRHLYHAYDGPFDGKKFNDDTERNRMIVGCGPYRLVSWEKGKRFIFQRYPKYFGSRCGIMPPIRDYVFEVVQHPGTRFQKLRSGDLDINNITTEQWLNNTDTPEFAEGGTLRKIKYPARVYTYIGLNLNLDKFKDRRVRVALSHLVNREKLLRDVYRGLARPVSGGNFIDSPSYDKSIQPYPFDVEKAKSLLAEAGWKDTDGDGILDKDGKPFTFTLMFPNANPYYPKIAPVLKEDFAKAGVRLELLSLEWSVVIQRIEQRKFEATMMGWTTPLMPDPFQLWHSSNAHTPGSSNFISFANPEADKLIETIRSSFDEGPRNEAYHKFHKLLHEEQPYLYLFTPYNLEVMSARYRNVKIFSHGVPDTILWVPGKEQKAVPGL